MAKTIRFDLPLNGKRIKTIDELRDNITIEILNHYKSGLLEKWLHSRGHNKELIKLKDVVVDDDRRLIKALCDILEVKLENLINSSEFRLNKGKAKNTKCLVDPKNSTLNYCFGRNINSKPIPVQYKKTRRSLISEGNSKMDEIEKKSRNLAKAKRLEEIRQEIERDRQRLKKEFKRDYLKYNNEFEIIWKEYEMTNNRLNIYETKDSIKKPEDDSNKSKPSIIGILAQLFK